MADTANPQRVRTDSAGRIARDVFCVGCGYNLRGLSPEQGCPECGRAIAPSLQGDRLQFADPDWLHRLGRGMAWIYVAFGLMLVNTYGLPLLLIGGLGWRPPAGFWRVSDCLPVLAMLPAGWLATTREPRDLGLPRRQWSPVVVRVLLVAGFVAVVAGHVLLEAGLNGRGPFQYVGLSEIVTALLIPAHMALWIHMARLADRIPARRLARATWVAAAGLAVLELAATVLSIAVHWLMQSGSWQSGPGQAWALRLWMAIGLCFLLQQVVILVLAIVYRRRFRRLALLQQA